MKPISLRRRKIRALRIFKQPAFRRSLSSQRTASEALEFIRKNFLDAEAFKKFTIVMPSKKSSKYVRLFRFRGAEFAVKDTEGSRLQGHSKVGVKGHEIRQFIKLHHNYFRKNKMREKASYILRTPRLFGVVGNYLLLEKINQWIPKSEEEISIYRKGLSELGDSLIMVSALNKNISIPQAHHFIPAGIYKGKVVFYTIYDYL